MSGDVCFGPFGCGKGIQGMVGFGWLKLGSH